jgi:hypothetical protein
VITSGAAAAAVMTVVVVALADMANGEEWNLGQVAKS